MTDPWLSVLMPIYNGAATLGRTLSSLQGQGAGIEIIAVVQSGDDGSRALLQAVPGVRIIEAPESTNWMQNTNIALRAARAPLITMLHQDDVWRTGRAAALKRAAEKPAGLWVHGAEYIDAADRVVGHIGPPFGAKARLLESGEALRHLLVQNTIALPAAMFRREEALRAGGLDETLWYTADWDLWLRLARTGPVAWEPEARVAFRIHANSLTVTGSRNAADFAQQLEIPVARHLEVLPPSEIEGVARLAQLSNALNVALAGAYHGQGKSIGHVLWEILATGPIGCWRFLRDTQILRRLAPRLKMKIQMMGRAGR